MTSSLVGSEMCIRDRKWDISMIAGFIIDVTKDAFHPLQDRDCALTLHFPVSYTHLTLPTICSV
eukprot:4608536-Prorocentrum_lima.AAC.1